MNKHNDDKDQGSTFWTKNTEPVPGRPSRAKELGESSQKNCSSMSFQDFHTGISDAWDIVDDEFCKTLDKKTLKQLSHSKALSVINRHQGKHEQEKLVDQQNQPSSSFKTKLDKHNYQRDSSVVGTHCAKTELQGNFNKTTVIKLSKFRDKLKSSKLNLDDLRQLSWSGIPAEVRPDTWRLLAGYLPLSVERRQTTVEKKRLLYWNLVKQYFNKKEDKTYHDTYKQIHVDIPRMSPLIALFQQKIVQEMFERILFIWAIRHPASGYVQGMNDLVTPFYIVFLEEFLPTNASLDTQDVNTLPKNHRDIIEADSFWCFSKFLDGIQDNYIFAQIGIQAKVKQLKELIQRIDGSLHKHLQTHHVDYLQFTFRWMNNLLTREMPLRCCVRLWDTYLAELDTLASFQLYVCAAFLLSWSKVLLLEQDFHGLMITIQNPATQHWTESDIAVLVAEAHRLQFIFADTPNHLQSNGN